MPRTDTGNFNRFLTSLGLLLLLAAVLVPYFYFHDTDTLRVPVKELKGLTQVGREALETRQQREADLEVWVLGFAVALSISGIGAVWFGGRRLRVAQGKEDAAIDRKAKRDDVEIEQMSQSEVDEKREVETRTALEEEQRQPEPAASDAPARPAPATPAPTGRADGGYEQHRSDIVRIENRVNQILAVSAPSSYEFIPDVKTSRGVQMVRLDGLFRAEKREGPDVILGLKVVRQARSLRMLTRTRADEMLGNVIRYRELTTRGAKGWLVLVLPEEAAPPEIEERRKVEDRLNQALVGLAVASVVHETNLDALPQRFDEIFCDDSE